MASIVNGTVLAASTTTTLVQAFQEGSLGVSFGIAGFLIGYLAGVAYLLTEMGIMTPDTKMAGASSGSLLSMSLCSGIPADSFVQIVQSLCNDCRKKGNCQGTLGSMVATAIPGFLPPDAYKRCSQKSYMSITVGRFPPPKPVPGILVADFTSNQDLAAAGAASSFIPMWSGRGQTTTKFRGMQAYDGFFSNDQPCPPGVKACLKISSKNPPWDNQDLSGFMKIFSRTASAGPLKPARLAKLPITTALESARPSLPADEALKRAAAMGVDIAPGIYSPLGIPDETWEELLVLPGDEAFNKYLWQLGRRDAQIFARITGLEAAAAAKKAQSKGPYAQG